MNKNNNKKIGLRSARMRQLAGMRQLTPADSFQALTVTASSSTPPITTLTLTANIYSSTSKSKSYLYTEKEDERYGCDPLRVYFFLSTDIILYENKDNLECRHVVENEHTPGGTCYVREEILGNIKNIIIIISVQGKKSTFIKFSDVEYWSTESLSSFFYLTHLPDKDDEKKYVFSVKVDEQNLSNGYYYKSSVYGNRYFDCEHTKLAFSLSSFNPL